MRSKKINLVVVPLLLSACSHNDGPLVQDVYNNQYDCAADWNTETCEEENGSGSGSEVLLLAFAIMVVLVLGVI